MTAGSRAIHPTTAGRSASAPSAPASAGRAWVVTELYHPEETSTGYLLTRIAEGLATDGLAVRVLCGQPTYSARGRRAPRTETRHGVRIERCAGTTFDKDFLPGRLLNLLTISASVFARALARFRRGDAVLVVTNPPLLPYLTLLACRLRGARCVLLVHDVYPEAMTAAGMFGPRSVAARVVGAASRTLYRAVDRVVVLGRDMHDLIAAKLPDAGARLAIIPNWADVDDIVPAPRATNALLAAEGLADRFVVQYAGNMGRTHALECVAAAARELDADGDVTFLLIGGGAKRAWVEGEIRDGRLRNVRLLGGRPREDQQNFLNACDVAVISFVAGMAGVSVPSRMYNILAAGKPIVAMADDESELARVVREARVGWVVPPGDAGALAAAIREARADRNRLRQMGARARRVAEERYAFTHAVARYRAVMREALGAP